MHLLRDIWPVLLASAALGAVTSSVGYGVTRAWLWRRRLRHLTELQPPVRRL